MPRGRLPRDYPPEVVERVRAEYLAGKTIAEIQAGLPGFKVRNIMRRHGIETRRAIARDQRGPRNPVWRGDAALYNAMHLRVVAARGRPSLCERCGQTNGKFEWANLTGAYADPADYARMCQPCHRRYDAERRRATGKRTTEGWKPSKAAPADEGAA